MSQCGHFASKKRGNEVQLRRPRDARALVVLNKAPLVEGEEAERRGEVEARGDG
jgi:hypothetical protein